MCCYKFIINLPEFLLALKRILEFVERLLQLGLNLVEVVHLILGSLQIFSCLLVDFLHVLLLLVELVDELILVGDLIVQVTDLVILGCLVLLGLLGIQMRLLVLLFQYSSTS